MALNNGKNEGEDKTFINLILRSTPGATDVQPKFVKLNDKFEDTDETYSEISGKLTAIKSTHTPAKGKRGEIFWFKAFIEDGDEIYVVSSTLTNASRDLLNALLVSKGKELKINLYLNKHQYPASSVKLADGNWAQTALEYNKIDNKVLFDLINWQTEGKAEELTAEDVPF